MARYDVLVIGAGAVGCAAARQVCRMRLGKGEKLTCLLVEKNEQVLSEASSGNTGHLATNFYYSAATDGREAPLEAALTSRAALEAEQWLKEQPNVPRRKAGLLYVARNEYGGQ